MPFDPEAYKAWTPAAQDKVAAGLHQIKSGKWRPFFCARPGCDGLPHDRWTWNHARCDQHPPKGDAWLTWFIRGGRGSGKTRTGSEWTHRRTKISPRIALISQTGPTAREIMVEGESGLLATAPPGGLPHYEPSKRRVTWPNGAMGHIYSAEEPDLLRGPQHYDAWLDEPAHMANIEEVWDNLLFGLRLGNRPRICATTTPKPTKWVKDLIKDPSTVSVVVSTYANLHNLAPMFRERIVSRYEGTRKGRQELHGEVLEDVEGSLWKAPMIDEHRVQLAPPLERVVVGVDPAGTANPRSDETGIIVAGMAAGEFYVLADGSGKYSPHGWATKVNVMYDAYSADRVVEEKNYGGDMVKSTLLGVNPLLPIDEVTSRRGKTIRADPIAALYERGRVHHVGLLNDLEDQLTSWVPGQTSPDRLDALVHALTALAATASPSSIASPTDLHPIGQI